MDTASATPQPAAAQPVQLPPVDKAAALELRIEQDVFFAKLSEAGIAVEQLPVPTLESLWRTGNQCYALQQHPRFKQAEAQQDPYLRAEQRLYEVMQQQGFHDGREKAAEEALSQQLAMAYAQNPDVYTAMLALEHAGTQA